MKGRKLNHAINISETLANSLIAFKVTHLIVLDPEQKLHVAWEELSAILLREEGSCLLLPGIIPKYSWLNSFSAPRVQLQPQEFTVSCLVEEEYPHTFEIFLPVCLPRSTWSVGWFPLERWCVEAIILQKCGSWRRGVPCMILARFHKAVSKAISIGIS